MCLALSACDVDLTNPTREEVAGEYQATRLTVGDEGRTSDALAAGATFQLTLRSDSTTAGLLFVPATLTAAGADAISMDLAGIWTLSGDGVTLLQRIEDVVRIRNLNIRGDDRLEFDFIIEGTRLGGVLRRR
jgi:hypothetical protein